MKVVDFSAAACSILLDLGHHCVMHMPKNISVSFHASFILMEFRIYVLLFLQLIYSRIIFIFVVLEQASKDWLRYSCSC